MAYCLFYWGEDFQVERGHCVRDLNTGKLGEVKTWIVMNRSADGITLLVHFFGESYARRLKWTSADFVAYSICKDTTFHTYTYENDSSTGVAYCNMCGQGRFAVSAQAYKEHNP